MGEYIKYQGKEIKLGTCEDLYYARLGQLEEAVAVDALEGLGGNLNPAEYLDPKNGWRYRFPFPEEDDIDMGDFKDYNKGLVIQLQPEDYGIIEGMEHNDTWHSCHPKGGGYNVNIATPCPQSKDFDWTFTQQPDNAIKKLNHSPMTWRIVEITQQKQVDGEVWTVIDCPYCIGKARIDREDALKLVHSIEVGYINCRDATDSNKEHYQKVIDRVMAGYTAIPVS